MILRLFPPPDLATCFKPGNLVSYRPKSAKEKVRRGTIVNVEGDVNRVNVQFVDDYLLRSVRRKRLVPVYETKDSCTTAIVTPETIEFRHMGASQLLKSDSVLEIGTSTGETSSILAKYAGSWIGFDISQEMIMTCRASVPPSCVSSAIVMDVLLDPDRAKALVEGRLRNGPSAVFVDIGGNRDLVSVVRTVHWVLDSFSPRLVVVKSRELASSIQSVGVQRDGMMVGGETWFDERVEEINSECSHEKIKHPLQAPLVVSPLDEKTPICRYYNYHKDGCKKADRCLLDHEHCHFCRETGHVARNCGRRVKSSGR